MSPRAQRGDRLSVRMAILAGGRATRYGGAPKGLVEVGGRRVLDRLVDAGVEAFGALPLLVANAPEASTWRTDLVVVPDRIADAGTLGGILTAVLAAPAPVVCVAWDMPFVPASLLSRLAAGLERFDAVLPESDGPRGLEPLCAGYGPGTLGPIEGAIARGDLRAIGFHQAIRLERVPAAEVAQFGDPARIFFNLNTPDDAVAAERLAREP